MDDNGDFQAQKISRTTTQYVCNGRYAPTLMELLQLDEDNWKQACTTPNECLSVLKVYKKQQYRYVAPKLETLQTRKRQTITTQAKEVKEETAHSSLSVAEAEGLISDLEIDSKMVQQS